MTDRELLAKIAASEGQKTGYKQLVRELSLGGGRDRRLLREQLARLTVRGLLVQPDREHWNLPRAAQEAPTGSPRGSREGDLLAGRLDLHRDGYGFVRPDTRQPETQDIFIPPDEIAGAMQGDQVLVSLDPPKFDGRRQGRILRVLDRRNQTVVGIFHSAVPLGRPTFAGWRSSRPDRERGNVVVPFDERITQTIQIPLGQERPAEDASKSPHRVLGAGTKASPKAKSPEGLENLEGMVVDVEITSWPTPTHPPVGRVIEILGSPDDFGVDVEMMIRKHRLPRIFPENVLAEARSVAHLDATEAARRRDFRDLPIVTIDGETAKDFDDAVFVRERPDGGYELQVHIADVSEYVRPGSLLDGEARLRGTSVYFPDRAIPMLPQELSTDICSLRPNEDRLVLSCLMQLDAEGSIESYEIVEGLIRSAARMTYTEVTAILDGDEEARARYSALTPEFERMKKLALLMNRRRELRGSIDFDLPEPVIEFDAEGRMSGVTRAERTWANRLIEEFMLAANECVASWIEDLAVPSLYRIHERPEARRVVEFEELAVGFGYSLGLGPLPVKRVVTRGDRRSAQHTGRKPRVHEIPEEIAVTPRMYQKLAARIEGKPEERILSYLMLRSLRQARYSETNEGHFALAAPTYTHFTSPIRRYPDLIVHRIAKSLLRAGVSGRGEVASGRFDSPWSNSNEAHRGLEPARAPHLRGSEERAKVGTDSALTPPIAVDELSLIAAESSTAERRAAEAERELVEWKKVRFMQDKVGDEFEALVLNPAKYGLFVELTDLFVEGLVPIDSLRGDRYIWRENAHEIVGERSGNHFRAGDRVQVILDRVLAQERKLQFSIVEEGISLTGKKTPKFHPKAKKKRGTSAPSRSFKARNKMGKKNRRR
jgi:ribonuclease R